MPAPTRKRSRDQGARGDAPSKAGLLRVLRALGPGIISGASDNDPTTVATMAVLGSTTGYGLSWLTILILPMLATVQIISAQVGLVARRGLQQAVREAYGVPWGLVLLLSVLSVNLFTVGADLEGGAAALGVLSGWAWQWFLVPLAVVVIIVLCVRSYDEVERILKFVLLVFVAYVASAFLAHPNWSAVLHTTLVPPISFKRTYIEGALAVLGTTLTSYAYVWESIEASEEKNSISHLGLARADAGLGMLFAVAMFWFILISSGATLGIHHQRVQTAGQAAQALKPLAGPIASDLFAIGLLASSLIAVPVLVASSAYIVGNEFGWRTGLSRNLAEAKGFYLVIAGSMIVGLAIAFMGISPIQVLFIAGIVGGIGTPVSLVFLLLISRRAGTMADHRVGRWLTWIGWAIAALIAAVSLYFIWQQFGTHL